MNKRTLILQTSRDVFFEFGYKKTTLEDIAERMQVQKGGIYYYFKSKEALFLDVLRFQHEDYKMVTQKSIEGTEDFRERVLAFFDGKIDYIYEHTNDRFSLSEDILQQFHFTGEVIEDFKNWETRFIRENLTTLLTDNLNQEGSPVETWMDDITQLLLIEISIISNELPSEVRSMRKKQIILSHVEMLIKGIEATYKK